MTAANRSGEAKSSCWAWPTRKTSTMLARSEERRVGKECRSRCDWSSDVCSSDLSPDRFDALNDRGKPVRGSKILLLGMAYKKNVDDAREIGRASCRERV